MCSIRILPDQVVSKIAAGEIVERPASVVKELIENSIDAMATSIRVNLLNGGKRLISVEDDGFGMSRDDALLSIERHATSKIHDAEDIENIITLGFRGEALPSISCVCRFEMTTKTSDELSGVKINIDGGILRNVQETGCPVGTLIEVKNLFYNIPPRMKFLRKTETELSNILDVIQRHAISSFNVAFEVKHNGRSLMMISPDTSLQQRLNEIFTDVELYFFEHREDGYRIYGYMTGPEDSKSSAYKIFTYVNQRPVKDRQIMRNILSAYGRILDKGRYPQGVLFIDTIPGSVDVNVHPTKNEVRFHNSFKVSGLIQKSIFKMLENGPWFKTLVTSKEAGDNVDVQSFHKTFNDNQYLEQSSQKNIADFPFLSESGTEYSGSTLTELHSKSWVKPVGTAFDDIFGNRGLFGQLEVVGQVGDSFIVCQSKRGLTLIDQHAAHERINYERFKKQLVSDKLKVQNLLVPVNFELSAHETSVVEDNYDLFLKFGFQLEKFGDNSFLLRSAPALLKITDFNTIITDVVGEISILKKQESLENIFDRLIATISCHRSVTANQRMDNPKIKYMLDELDKTEMPFFCPHGRPVSKEFTFQELERFFKRT